MIILAGDIGGTQTRIALFNVIGTNLTLLIEKTYSSTAYASFESIVKDFLSIEKFTASAVCLGIAGPIREGRCNTTNLPWRINTQDIAQVIGIDDLTLINDLEANAWGIRTLSPEDLCVINIGTPSTAGNACIISAGTGLGEAGLYWDGSQYYPYATEGGHSDFAASTEEEFRLHTFLKQRYGHVSWERVVSGIGVVNIFEFLITDRSLPMPAWYADCAHRSNAASEISRRSFDGKCPTCTVTMDLFVRLYGAETGNLALKTMATGGVYIGGGIAPKILDKLQTPLFFESFKAKGRMADILNSMPVKVILNDQTALYGAALYGASHTG